LTPSVFAVASAGGVTIHCQVLGEYPSNVERIDIVEKRSGRLVWRIRAQGGMFQLHEFNLASGPNSGAVRPFRGSFRTETPVQGAFDLEPGIKYQAFVCEAGWLRICRSTEFTL
jgi:hypothetical protein